jgi:manganese/zinc/iron transport system substrate-binding protein
MPPGVDPHLYKPTQNDLTRLRAADLVFYNGLKLEGKMTEALETMGREKKVVPVAERLPRERLRQTHPNEYDPHVWFDPKLWAQAARVVADALFETTRDSSVYDKCQKYQSRLMELDAELRAILAPLETRTLVTAHDAFEYFGAAYDVEVIGLQGLSTSTEAGLRDVAKLVNLVVERKIKAVFVESSVPPGTIEAVVEGCRQKGWAVKIGGTLYSDALGPADSPAGDYIGMMRHNARTFVEAMRSD